MILKPLHHIRHIKESVVPGKRLGRHIEHDPASISYAMASDMRPQQSVWWQRHCDPYDQANLGSCTGNALTGLLMTGAFYVPGRELTEADAVNLYGSATRYDRIPGVYPPDDTGSSGIAVCRAAKIAKLIDGYHHAFTMQAVLNALQQGPVITGINWYDSFDSPEASGLIGITADAVVRGGHEVECFGFDAANSLAWFWQSWGPTFGATPPVYPRPGVKGAFCMHLTTWARLLKEHGDVTAPTL